MLTPAEIAAVGMSAAIGGAKAEDACVAALARLAAQLGGASLTEALGMGMRVPGIVMGTLRDTPIVPSRQLVSVVSDALGRSARRDAKALGVTPEALERALSPGHNRVSAERALMDGLKATFARDNLAMASDARDTWTSAVSEWVPKAARGEVSYETAVERIVRECADRGVKVVDYRSGRRDSPDVAARRHVITQIQQASASRTADAASKMGDGLVFVSSHVGARPSHREWQGRPYAVHGPKTIDGVAYPDLAEATGYGTVGGLCGASCRHSFGPWQHWQTRPYSPTPDEDAGLDPDEAYRATQAQRANERAIRKAKREAQAAREAGLDDTDARLRLGRAQRAQRDLLSENRWLTRRPDRERAYGSGGEAVAVRPLTGERAEAEEKFMPTKAKGTSFDVSRRAVNGKSYEEKYVSRLGVGKKAGRQLYADARRILRETDGTELERLSVVSAKTGRRVADNFSAEPQRLRADLTERQKEKLKNVDGGVIMLHNHPGSSPPSPADIISASDANVKASVIACHDGTVYKLTCDEPEINRIYEGLRDEVRRANPWVSDANIIENKAMDMLYEENEAERWFRVVKI